MEAAVNTELDAKRKEEQAQIDKIQSEHCFIGHPFGIGIVSFKFFMTSLTSYGMSAILIYYFYATSPEGLGLTKIQASQMITLNSAIGSIFSVIGSYMSDRVFGNRKAYRFVCFTGPFLYFLLAIPGLGMTGVIMQYALGNVNSMICGSSLYTLMGKLYAKGDKRRDGAFAITYVLSNIGAMSPIVAGTLAKVAGYHFTFFVLGILGALGSLIYLIFEKRAFGPIGMEPDDPLPPAERKKAIIYLIVGTLVFCGILAALFLSGVATIANFSNTVSTLTLFLPAAYFVFMYKSKKTTREEAHKLLYIIPMFIAASFAMMVWYQATTILAIYAETSVDLNFFGHEVSPTIYMTLQAIMAIVFGSIITGLWSKLGDKQPSTPWKMGFGTMLYGVGTLIMILPFQLYAPGVKVSPFWLVAFYMVVIIGEGISYPAGSASASALAPAAFATQMMQTWTMSMTAGASLSNLASNFYKEGSETMYFLLIGGSTLLVGLVIVLISKKLAKEMGLSNQAA